MTQARLLTDAKAIRSAVGNPHSHVDLAIPILNKLEACEAKDVLLNALTLAEDASRCSLHSTNIIETVNAAI